MQLLKSDAFLESLDYTFNKHNSSYNARVIRKAVTLVVDGIIRYEIKVAPLTIGNFSEISCGVEKYAKIDELSPCYQSH